MESKIEVILKKRRASTGIEIKDMVTGEIVFGPEEVEKLPREVFEQLKQNYKKGNRYVIQMEYMDLML